MERPISTFNQKPPFWENPTFVQGPLVFLIENEPFIREIYSMTLEKEAKVKVIALSSPQDLPCTLPTKFLIISDYFFANAENGLLFFDSFRSLGHKAPFILFSGYLSKQILQYESEFPNFFLISKTEPWKVLINKVKDLFERPV